MKPARIGVIGAGWWAVVNHIPVLKKLPDCEVVAVNRLGEAELAEVQRTFAIPEAFEDFRAMLDAVPMDGVVISSPHVAHFEHAKAALEKGCHVLIEKPMTASAAEARELTSLARDKGREIVIAYGWNFKPWVAEARKLVPGVGRIEHVVLQMANALEDLFAGKPMVETEGAMFRPPPSTWADPKRAGGFGWGQLVHPLGLLFQVADLEPASVYALTGQSPAGVDYYDAAVVRFGNGATGALSGAATLPKGRPVQIDLRIFGTEGMLLSTSSASASSCAAATARTSSSHWRPATAATPARSRSASSSTPASAATPTTPAPGIVGQRAVEVLDAMYRSAASGREEKV